MENAEIVMDEADEKTSSAQAEAEPINQIDSAVESENQKHRGAIFSVPLEVVISVGRAFPSLGELASFSRDTLLTLNSKIDDPVEVLVNGRVIAQGELQETDDKALLAVRITKVVDTGL